MPTGDEGAELSIVVVAYESGEVLPACLRALRTVRPDCEVIVVDNASKIRPPDRAVLTEMGARLLRNSANEGFGRACNRGAIDASNPYVLFLNPDVELVSLPRAICELRTDGGGFGVVAPKAGQATHGVFSEPGPLKDALGALLAPYWPRQWPRPPWAHRSGHDWASGAAMLVDRQEFLSFGGFHDGFFFLYEDRELSRRYRLRGLPIREVEGFTCEHVVGASVEGAREDMDVLRRYLGLLGLIEYWYVTRGAATAWRWGRMALGCQRGMAMAARLVATVAPRSRVANKSTVEFAVAALLRTATPKHGALRAACDVVRGYREPKTVGG